MPSANVPRAGSAARPLTPAQQLAAAEKALLASDYAAAEAGFRAARAGGAGAGAELGLAEVLLATGRLEPAVISARKAAQQENAELAARSSELTAEALSLSGQLQEAEAELRRALERSPARVLRLALGELLLRRGQRQEAEVLLSSLVEDYNASRVAASDAEELSLTARAAWLLRSPKDANTLFNEAEGAGPASARTLLWRAEAYLEKYDAGHAEEVLAELLRKAPHHPLALTRLAQVKLDQALDFDEAERLARAALTQNPRLTNAYFVLAGIALRDMELERADGFITQGLSANPRDLDLLSLRAVVRFLADDEAGFQAAKQAVLRENPRYSRLYAILGEYADWEHRYDEIVVLMREALALDAEDSGALAQLGLNLIRAGEEGDGVSWLNRAFTLDPYNVRVYNTLELYDTVIPRAYVSVRHPRFNIRYHKADRPLLERYVPSLLDRAFEAMQSGYGFAPQTPIGIEIYAERQSFAIRTSGLPHTAIQGVCFGKTLASMSPQKESFNLGMTLWHELSHVFHIQLSKSRVPRWFTEGLAEYETLVTRREWSRHNDPELYDMRRAGKLPAVAQMSRAFTRAEDIRDVATAYYASSKLVEMLASRYGRPKMAELLRAWGNGERSEAAFRRVLGVSAADVDQAFRLELDAKLAHYTKQFVPLTRFRAAGALDALLKEKPRDADLHVERALSLARDGDTAAAKVALARGLALSPKHAQGRFLQARLARATDDVKAAEELLRGLLRDGHDGYAIDLELADLALERGDTASARAALETAHRWDPSQVEPLLRLADLAAAEKVPDDELAKLRLLAPLAAHNPPIHQRLMRRLLDEKLHEEAVSAGEAALWSDLFGLSTHVLFAEALVARGDRARARFELESAVLCQGTPAELADAHLRLAELWRLENQSQKARSHVQVARQLDPDNPRLRSFVAKP